MATIKKKMIQITKFCVYVQLGILLYFTCNCYAQPASQQMSSKDIIKDVQMVTPADNGMVYNKKPVIECVINIPFDENSLYVELDYTDISALVKMENGRLRFKPVQVMQAGSHQLSITFTTLNGIEIVKQFNFFSRHSKLFETAYSRNTASVGYTNILKKYHDAKDREMSGWTAKADLRTENYLAQGPWAFTFEANGRYYDQETPPETPLEDTLELVNFLLTGKYEKKQLMVSASVGNILANESRNTVNNLSRRGGKFVAEYGPAGLSGFVVRSDQIYGSDGDYGLELDSDDHILGISGDLDLFEKRTNIKAIYISGGTQADDTSFGVWDKVGGTKGDVKGVVLTTDFFENKFATSFEFDRSNYDSNTADAANFISDKAYLLKAGGTISRFSYSAEYEYTGLNYQVPGNTYMRNDWEGYTLSSSLLFEKHQFEAAFSKYNDDVENDSQSGRTYTTEYILNYGLNVFAIAPITFSWSRSIEEKQLADLDSYTDTYSSSISYIKDPYNISFTPSYSKTNDKTMYDLDTSNLTLYLSASYFKEKFSIQPSISFNRSKDCVTDVNTDTQTYELSFTATIAENFTVNNNGSFSHITENDDSMDQTIYCNTFQLTYKHQNRIFGILSPKASLGASYERSKDEIMDSETKETIIYVTLSGDFEISF